MKRQLANVSPWILAAACTLLTFIIGAFAVNNYSREKMLMTDALLQKGLAVIRFLDTGVRVSMRANWQNRTVDSGGSWTDHVQSVIDQLRDQPDIHYVELIDATGVVLAASNPEMVGKKVASETLLFIREVMGSDPVFRMYRNDEQGEHGFQVAQPFKPRIRQGVQQGGLHGRGMMENMRRMQPGLERMQQELDKLQGQNFVLLVELDLEQFSSAVRRQLWQIAILSVALLLVGVGGWLSLLTLQGFKGTQSRLQRIRAFNDILVESLPVGIIATDGAGHIQMVNAAAEEISGISADRIINRPSTEVLPEVLSRPLASQDRYPGKPHSAESVIETPEGRSRSLFTTVLSVADDEGNLTGDVLLIQDVSELRQLESELRRSERMAALGKMAAGVAHELRNPLSSIKGLAVLLKAKVAGDPEGNQTADVLVKEVERLNRSISELLDYARPEKLQLEPVSLRTILEKATTLVGIDAESLGVAISTAYLPDGDIALVDEDKMNQVFLNLLLNALQAMVNGGELNIRTELDKQMILCIIEDNGEGIAKENLSRIFDPYFTTKSDGTGLGLALSAKIVEEHGGSITLESRHGYGTRVMVRLPSLA